MADQAFVTRYVSFSHTPTRSFSRIYQGVAEFDATRNVYVVLQDDNGKRTPRFEVWYANGWKEMKLNG